jgi:primosomal protein N' (replication factor Y)
MVERIARGTRVVVPVRTRELVGVVLDVGGEPPNGLKRLLLAPDETPGMVPDSLLALAGWMSRYYVTPIGLTLRAMLPPGLWGASRVVARRTGSGTGPPGAGRDVLEALERAGGEATATALSRTLKRPVWDILHRLMRSGSVALRTEPPDLGPAAGTIRLVKLTRSLPTILEREHVFGRARRQRAAYEAIDALGGEATMRHLREQLGFSHAVIRGLVERSVGRVEDRQQLRDPFVGIKEEPPASPTGAQREAVDAIRALSPGGAAIVFGVTGSGKTLVYLEALRGEVERGRGAIVLVPEIALTPQTIARVRGAFGDSVAVLHSGLSGGERVDAWRALVSGQKRVAVGARSAVFAPVQRLSALVVDEEHDGSYKHGEAPRYHARDVALRRVRLEGARAVLGSATPSLETWAVRGRMRTIHLPARVGARPLPPVQLIDMRKEERIADSGPVPWSRALDDAVSRAIDLGEQAILLLNRRGFAHFLRCLECGHVPDCPSCSISLTVHQAPPSLRCHYCGHEDAIPDACSQCGQQTQRTRGIGTQHLERWLAERYPGARLARMDADTTSRRWSHGRILEAVGRREVDLLFGTQMIAKGLDFPGVTVVGVVDADIGLHLPDFRAAERTFQLIAQVAGRAGRGEAGGRVLVQTRAPDHYALTAAAVHDFERFAARELDVRRSPPYPPHVGLVNVLMTGSDEPAVANAAIDIADWLRELVSARAQGVVQIVGPAPAPLVRIKGRWRWHLLLRASERKVLSRIVQYAVRRAPHAARGAIRAVFDRDPVSLL